MLAGRSPARSTQPASSPPTSCAPNWSESQARVFELEETLADAREELEAVREINRELLAAQNRSGR